MRCGTGGGRSYCSFAGAAVARSGERAFEVQGRVHAELVRVVPQVKAP